MRKRKRKNLKSSPILNKNFISQDSASEFFKVNHKGYYLEFITKQ